LLWQLEHRTAGHVLNSEYIPENGIYGDDNVKNIGRVEVDRKNGTFVDEELSTKCQAARMQTNNWIDRIGKEKLERNSKERKRREKKKKRGKAKKV